MTVRPATPDDYGFFARLFPELRAPDAVPTADKFEREMMATTFIAERDGRPAGVAHWLVFTSTGHLRILISAPTERRRGVARELMTAVRARFREAGCERWQLNVFPDNEGAIALYESFGLAKAWRSRALWFPWSLVDDRPPADPTSSPRRIDPADDAHVEHESGILPGLIADARAKDRVLYMIERAEQVTAATVFDPTFPGAYPFRAKTIDDAVSLLHALRPHARPTNDGLAIATEDQESLADALVTLGAQVRVETLHMRGALD